MVAPASQTEGLERLQRIYDVTGCRTQKELADVLGVVQSTISDAKHRATVPSDWLITLFLIKRINPEWILSGHGPRYVPILVHDSI